MTVSIDYDQLQKHSKELQVPLQSILNLLQHDSGLTCEEIASCLNKLPVAVEKALRHLEISKKVVPRIRRTNGHRECCYYLPSQIELIESQTKKQKENHQKQPKKTKSVKIVDGSVVIRFVEYKPPFVDEEGNQYSSFDALVASSYLTYHAVRYRVRVGAIGCEGKPPTYQLQALGLPPQKYFPPYVDREGNQFSSYREGMEFYKVSYSTFTRWVATGVVGSNGNSPTNRLREGSRGNLKYLPPYIDKEGNVYLSRLEIQEAFNISKKCVGDQLYRGKIGANGNLPPDPYPKKRAITDGVNAYDSVADAVRKTGLSRSHIQYQLCEKKDKWRYLYESR